MSKTRGETCSILPDNSTSISSLIPSGRASCVLIVEDGQLLGIFTERDIVKLTAAGTNFRGVIIGEVMVHPVITLSEIAFQDIFAAVFLFRRYRIRHLAIVNELNQCVGIVSPESIRRVLRPSNLLKLRRVSEVMSRQVIQAPLKASVLRLAQLMAEHQVSCVVIIEQPSQLDEDACAIPVGIVTERDIVQFQALQLNLSDTTAQMVMSTPLFLLNPEDSLWMAHQEMQKWRVQRLVVSWDWGQKLGIITQTSLLRIFDPIEMYAALEILQQTAPTEIHSEANSIGDRAIEILLSTIEQSLENLITNPPLSPGAYQRHILAALAELNQIRRLLNRG
jgi:signal-transduction protein with cAMP-binding, CBS, and nucleotidyltransferase domain